MLCWAGRLGIWIGDLLGWELEGESKTGSGEAEEGEMAVGFFLLIGVRFETSFDGSYRVGETGFGGAFAGGLVVIGAGCCCASSLSKSSS